jgi:hypothetical protein
VGILKVEVIFVTPKHTGFMKFVSNLVKAATGSPWSHVGIYLFDGVFEAVMPQVMISPKDKYTEENCEKIEFVTVEMSESGYENMLLCARRMLKEDIKYGYFDCFVAWWADFISKRQAKWIAKLVNTHQTSMCAGTVATLLHNGRVKCLKKEDGELITPQELYSTLKAYC